MLITSAVLQTSFHVFYFMSVEEKWREIQLDWIKNNRYSASIEKN